MLKQETSQSQRSIADIVNLFSKDKPQKAISPNPKYGDPGIEYCIFSNYEFENPYQLTMSSGAQNPVGLEYITQNPLAESNGEIFYFQTEPSDSLEHQRVIDRLMDDKEKLYSLLDMVTEQIRYIERIQNPEEKNLVYQH